MKLSFIYFKSKKDQEEGIGGISVVIDVIDMVDALIKIRDFESAGYIIKHWGLTKNER